MIRVAYDLATQLSLNDISLLARAVFANYLWLKIIAAAAAFDLLVTLPVTLYLKHRLEETT